MSGKIVEGLKKTSHRLPARLYRLVNESFEISRGSIYTIRSSSNKTKKIQRQLLEKKFKKDIKNLIIFLTPGVDMVNGGILSVTSLFEETKKLKHIHDSESILCTYPSDPPLLKYTQFKNDNFLYNFSDTLRYFGGLENLVVHVPEHFVYRFYWVISQTDKSILRKIKNVQLNIMIQNLSMLPSNRHFNKLRQLGKLTSTTAHSNYSTLNLRNQLGFPLHKLSVFVSPEKYYMKKYGEKENLMIVSPDLHPRKAKVLNKIRQELPRLQIKIIRNMKYEEYKETISRAKWALTFGEGLDGYFVESIFSGSISFSVYNSSFFTADFKALPTVYDSYAVMLQKITQDMASLDNEQAYTEYQKKQFSLCHKYYDYKDYVANLEAFYRKNYTFK